MVNMPNSNDVTVDLQPPILTIFSALPLAGMKPYINLLYIECSFQSFELAVHFNKTVVL